MAFQCNIGRTGRIVRAISGVLLIGCGAVLIWRGWPTPGPAALWLAGGLSLAGLFQIVEAAAGWCALRAMGYRTPV